LKKNSLVIGICGGSGSGKTSIINALKEAYADSKPTVLSMDNYYFPIDKQQVDENGKVNFDLPESLDREALYRDLLTLLRGESVEISEYGFNHREHDSKLLLEPSEIILIEGLFLFYYSEIASLLDYSIFIDVPEPIQLERRLERDMVSRGYSKEAILYQWNNHVLPCYEQYVLPFKTKASLVVMNNRHIRETIREALDGIACSGIMSQLPKPEEKK
jgi:uridine kinase